MGKVGICGHFGGGKTFLDGQTVKTKILTSELCRQIGTNRVLTVDTYGGASKTFAHLRNLGRLLRQCDHVIILPAHNAVRVFAPFLVHLNHIYHRKLHYVVIGGWLPQLLSKNPGLAGMLKRFSWIYVETKNMQIQLQSMGFENIVLMKNFKNLQILSGEQLKMNFLEPYPLCTFSRVNREKGIEEAVAAVEKVNQTLGRTVFTLDIFGQVESGYAERFQQLQKTFPPSVRYGGLVPFDQTTQVLKDYYALLFPTHYFTEGIPGTFIDAYAAGVPAISARWQNWQDVIEEGMTGLTFPFEDYEAMEQLLLNCGENPQILLDLRKNCLVEAENYLPSREIVKLLERLS